MTEITAKSPKKVIEEICIYYIKKTWIRQNSKIYINK